MRVLWNFVNTLLVELQSLMNSFRDLPFSSFIDGEDMMPQFLQRLATSKLGMYSLNPEENRILLLKNPPRGALHFNEQKRITRSPRLS